MYHSSRRVSGGPAAWQHQQWEDCNLVFDPLKFGRAQTPVQCFDNDEAEFLASGSL
jgi:hypothetical protein